MTITVDYSLQNFTYKFAKKKTKIYKCFAFFLKIFFKQTLSRYLQRDIYLSPKNTNTQNMQTEKPTFHL